MWNWSRRDAHCVGGVNSSMHYASSNGLFKNISFAKELSSLTRCTMWTMCAIHMHSFTMRTCTRKKSNISRSKEFQQTLLLLNMFWRNIFLGSIWNFAIWVQICSSYSLLAGLLQVLHPNDIHILERFLSKVASRAQTCFSCPLLVGLQG